MRFRFPARTADVKEVSQSVAPKRQKKHLRPGPKPSVGGKRMNFLPGDDLRKKMDKLCALAWTEFRVKINASFILREGGYDQCRKLNLLFRKSRKGLLGPKQRKSFIHDLTGV